MTKKKAKKKSGGSWRNIRQSARQVKVSSIAKQRYLKFVLRTAGAGLLLIALGGVGWGAYFLLEKGSKKITSFIPSSPVAEIEFVTDGVAPKEWALDRIELPEGIPLMEVDIHALKEDLERHDQIRRAVVTRRLPDKLSLRLEERVPMLRLAARDDRGRRVNLVVADDGVVYQGIGYDRARLAAMPYISGVRLRRDGGGFRRLEGMEPVAELLALARSETPELYGAWNVVDCADLPLIRVRTEEISEVVFRNEAFPRQLARLQEVLLYKRREMSGMPYERVDLSLGTEADVPVSLH